MEPERTVARKGETIRVTANAVNGDGDPIDLAGWGIAATVRRGGVSGPVQHEFDFDGGTSAKVDTAGWAPGIYVYDVRFTDPDSGDEFYSNMVITNLYDGPTPPAT